MSVSILVPDLYRKNTGSTLEMLLSMCETELATVITLAGFALQLFIAFTW